MKFGLKYLAIMFPLTAAISWYDVPVKISQFLLAMFFAQPDAKIANGAFWAQFWISLILG